MRLQLLRGPRYKEPHGRIFTPSPATETDEQTRAFAMRLATASLWSRSKKERIRSSLEHLDFLEASVSRKLADSK